MTDLERPSRHSTAWSKRGLRLITRVALPVLVVVVPMSLAPSGAGAISLATEQAKAAALEAEIQSTGQQIDALDQKYEAAEEQKAAIDAQIAATEAQIDQTKGRIARDRGVLRKAAVEEYVTGGTSATADPLFSGNQTTAIDTTLYHQVIAGDLTTDVADLNTAVGELDVQRQTLQGEDAQAAQQVAAADAAYRQAQTLEAAQEAELSQVKGEIATLVAEDEAAQEASEQVAAQLWLASHPLPPASGGAGTIAVRAAETQLGVPYVWGAESPGVGFDCSGLTAWAWGQAGVYLPHYSGAQFEDSTPVPIDDLEPGDLLFYGPGGSQHVAMYVGGGEMIEAPQTGTVVRIDPVRFGTDFAGAGRP